MCVFHLLITLSYLTIHFNRIVQIKCQDSNEDEKKLRAFVYERHTLIHWLWAHQLAFDAELRQAVEVHDVNVPQSSMAYL